MRVAFDTNILVYAEGVDDERRAGLAFDLLVRHARDEAVIPAQVALELYNLLLRKFGLRPDEVAVRLDRWLGDHELIATDDAVIRAAMVVMRRHSFGWWDAVILASAAQGGCSVLYSEDMQDGFAWRGVTVRNPFAA